MRCPRCRSHVKGGGYTAVGKTYCLQKLRAEGLLPLPQ